MRHHGHRHHEHEHEHGHRHRGRSSLEPMPLYPDRRFVRPDPLEIGGRGGRHRGDRRRLFDHGDLRFILLGMIADKPAHGYDLIKALGEKMGGGYSPSPGVIYPTLTMLEEQGYAAATSEDGKKLYAATDAGRAFLQDNNAAYKAIQTRMDARARERGVELPPRIIRAIENLRVALRLRLDGGPISDERAAAMAAAIDAAAAEVEKP